MPKKSISLPQACEGMSRYKQATGKSENTIVDTASRSRSSPIILNLIRQLDPLQKAKWFYLEGIACANANLNSNTQYVVSGLQFLRYPSKQ